MAEMELEPLFVINKTDSSMTIGIVSRNKDVVLNIPETILPIDLTLQYKRSDIEESPDYRRAIGLGLIQRVNTEAARRILHLPENAEEQQRILSRNMASKADVTGKFEEAAAEKSSASPSELIVSLLESLGTESNQVSRYRVMVNAGKVTEEQAKAVRTFAKTNNSRKLFNAAKEWSGGSKQAAA